MSQKSETTGIRAAVGIFMNADDLKRAGQALLASGFDRTALGLLAGKEAVESSLGDLYTKANANAGHADAPHMGLVRQEALGSTVDAWLGGMSVAGTTALGAAVVAFARRPCAALVTVCAAVCTYLSKTSSISASRAARRFGTTPPRCWDR